jgi:hypothetical protein
MNENLVPNRLTTELAVVCRERLLEEKWLIAPTLRIGHQWLEAVARSGQPAVHVRVKTVKSWALGLAAPEMVTHGVTPLDALGGEIFADRTLDRLPETEIAYFASGRGRGLARALSDTGSEVRLCGVAMEGANDGGFEVADKASTLRRLFAAYADDLRTARVIDYSDVLRLAIVRVRAWEQDSGWPLLLVPSDAALRGLERELIAAFMDLMTGHYRVPELFEPWVVGLASRESLGSSTLGCNFGLVHQYQRGGDIHVDCPPIDWWLFLFPDGIDWDSPDDEPVHALVGHVSRFPFHKTWGQSEYPAWHLTCGLRKNDIDDWRPISRMGRIDAARYLNEIIVRLLEEEKT